MNNKFSIKKQSKIKVLFFPYGLNPYQSLLKDHLFKEMGILVKPFNNDFIDKHGFILGILFFPFRLLYFRLRGFNILHLHWITAFMIQFKNKYFHFPSLIYIIYFLIILKILNYKIVWTIHNLKSHDGKFVYDKLAGILISKLVNAKIIHSNNNYEEMKKIGYNTKNTYVIPHGNYISVYENTISRQTARHILKISNENYVLLFFGRVEKYKGIENLIEEFINLFLPNSNLLIVGYCSDKSYQDTLLKYKKDNIYFNFSYIEDEKVQIYFNAADVAAYPFTYITTSGSAILSLSFGKAVIAPLLGNIVDLPKNIGFFYPINDEKGLREAIMQSAIHKSKLPLMGKDAYNYAKSISWEKIAGETCNVYKKVLKL